MTVACMTGSTLKNLSYVYTWIYNDTTIESMNKPIFNQLQK